jgi:hypothetical protein
VASGHIKIHFESTFTNILNHSNFAPPSSLQVIPNAAGNPAFRELGAAQIAENAGNRTGQVALRLDF